MGADCKLFDAAEDDFAETIRKIEYQNINCVNVNIKKLLKNISHLNAYNFSIINRYINVPCPHMIINCISAGRKI